MGKTIPSEERVDKVTTVCLTHEQHEKITEIAWKRRISLSAYIRELIDKELRG